MCGKPLRRQRHRHVIAPPHGGRCRPPPRFRPCLPRGTRTLAGAPLWSRKPRVRPRGRSFPARGRSAARTVRRRRGIPLSKPSPALLRFNLWLPARSILGGIAGSAHSTWNSRRLGKTMELAARRQQHSAPNCGQVILIERTASLRSWIVRNAGSPLVDRSERRIEQRGARQSRAGTENGHLNLGALPPPAKTGARGAWSVRSARNGPNPPRGGVEYSQRSHRSQ